MADYPSYTSIPQHPDSRRTPLGRSNQLEMAEDGTIRGVNMEAVSPFEFAVLHVTRPLADATTIEDHYDSEGATAFNFTWALDNAVYTCRYRERPVVEPITGAGTTLCNIRVLLWGTKN